MIKNIKSKKNLLMLAFILLFIVSGSIAYFFNTITFNKTVNNKKEYVHCNEENVAFGDVNISCTNDSSSKEKVVFRFKYDSYWKYQQATCLLGNITEEGTYYSDPNDYYHDDHDDYDDEQEVPTDPTELIAYNLGIPLNYSYLYDSENDRTVTFTWDDDFSNNFIYNNGWYYYKKTLNPGDTIDILDSITNNKDDVYNARYYFDFSHENAILDSNLINEIWNVTYSIDDYDNITWNF